MFNNPGKYELHNIMECHMQSLLPLFAHLSTGGRKLGSLPGQIR